MTSDSAVPIACTLDAGDYKERLAWIAEINRVGLIDRKREGGRLELTYRTAIKARVREMIRREQQCCAFLTFEMRDDADVLRVVIQAPEGAEQTLDALFEPSNAPTESGSACGCSSLSEQN